MKKNRVTVILTDGSVYMGDEWNVNRRGLYVGETADEDSGTSFTWGVVQSVHLSGAPLLIEDGS